MPIYEHICTKCEHEFERLMKLSDKPLKKCPSCGKIGVERLISTPGFRLIGEGFYENNEKMS